MTWEEIKKAVEALGVKNSDVIAWIDLHPYGPESIENKRDQEGKVQIYDS